jgi:hypothetical protein
MAASIFARKTLASALWLKIACLASPFGSPSLLLAVENRRRHYQMDMRVIIELARVRVQHRNGAGSALQLLVVVAESTHRFPTTLHQRRVHHALVRPGERPEFGRQGKGQQEILGGHLFLQLAFQPLLALVMLAVGAVAMAAGVRQQFLMVTFGALDLHLAAELGAALLHGCQCPIVHRGEPVAVLRQKVRLKGCDDFSEADHLICPQAIVKPSIRALIRSRA